MDVRGQEIQHLPVNDSCGPSGSGPDASKLASPPGRRAAIDLVPDRCGRSKINPFSIVRPVRARHLRHVADQFPWHALSDVGNVHSVVTRASLISNAILCESGDHRGYPAGFELGNRYLIAPIRIFHPDAPGARAGGIERHALAVGRVFGDILLSRGCYQLYAWTIRLRQILPPNAGMIGGLRFFLPLTAG
jgi:hypothetical protein